MFFSLFSTFKFQRTTALLLLAGIIFIAGNELAVAQEEQMVPTADLQSQNAEQAVDPQPQTTNTKLQDTQNEATTQASQGTRSAEFNLNASVVDGLELSREGIKTAPQTKQSASVEQALPLPLPTAVAAAMPPIPTNEPGAFSAGSRGAQNLQNTPAGVIPLKSGTSLSEYGVDWSSWMSAVADRWYLQLRRLEVQSPYEFYTDGPAQIEFTCYPNGQVGNIALRRSCGVPMYDRMQIDALLSTAPMPPFPKGTQRMSYTVCQGWEAHARRPGEGDFQPGSFGRGTPVERVQQWN